MYTKIRRIIPIIILTSYITTIHTNDHIYNSHPLPMPPGVDGTLVGINGEKIFNLLSIAKQVNDLLLGKINAANHNRQGRYAWEGKFCSVQELHVIEKTWKSLSSSQQHTLHKLLEQAKRDLLAIAEPFIEEGRAVKALTLKLLHAWATKHQRENSFLLHWSKEEDGKETETFINEVKSFAILEAFCQDLISFISDLIKSCPRAFEQFKDMKKHGI